MRGTGTEQPVIVMTARESGLERRGCVIGRFQSVNLRGDERCE
jgi:hypothetical protein